MRELLLFIINLEFFFAFQKQQARGVFLGIAGCARQHLLLPPVVVRNISGFRILALLHCCWFSIFFAQGLLFSELKFS